MQISLFEPKVREGDRPLKLQKTKSISARDSYRSSDVMSANFILGCNAKCGYCYEKRWGREKIYVNVNCDEILDECDKWIESKQWPKEPFQTDDTYYVVDIGCNTDISYHWKDYDWIKVFDWFKNHPKAKGTFATKYVNNKLLEYNPEGKMRVRFSLMPQIMSDILEPQTTSISKRIKAIDKFSSAGYEVHVNFSPVVVYNGWEEDYDELFRELSKVNTPIKSEVIFLTHNEKLHNINLCNGNAHMEEVMWTPEVQELKNSNHGGENLRYQFELKRKYIKTFKKLYSKYFDVNTIRYIF